MNKTKKSSGGKEKMAYSGHSFDFKLLVIVMLSSLVVCMLAFPKIYLRSTIYYKSRNINTLLNQYEALKEENRLLEQKVESIKFKNQILDTLF